MEEVLLELPTLGPDLCRVPTTTASYHKGTSRPIGVLPEIKAMVLPAILLRVTWNLLKVMVLRCDEVFGVLRCNWRFNLLVF
jgi:hypothetical protein